MQSLRNEIQRREKEVYTSASRTLSHDEDEEDDNVFDDPNYVSPPRPADAPPKGQSGFNKEYSAPHTLAPSVSLETIRQQMLLEREEEKAAIETLCPIHNMWYPNMAGGTCPSCFAELQRKNFEMQYVPDTACYMHPKEEECF
jgi:hypothetical protein